MYGAVCVWCSVCGVQCVVCLRCSVLGAVCRVQCVVYVWCSVCTVQCIVCVGYTSHQGPRWPGLVLILSQPADIRWYNFND